MRNDIIIIIQANKPILHGDISLAAAQASYNRRLYGSCLGNGLPLGWCFTALAAEVLPSRHESAPWAGPCALQKGPQALGGAPERRHWKIWDGVSVGRIGQSDSAGPLRRNRAQYPKGNFCTSAAVVFLRGLGVPGPGRPCLKLRRPTPPAARPAVLLAAGVCERAYSST